MLSNRWAALSVLCFVRVWMGFQFQSIPPIAPLLMDELGLNHTQIGLLIGLFMLPGIVIALPGAMLGARLGDRNTVMLGLALMGAGGLLLVWGGSFWLACAGRVLSGVGAVTLNVQLMKMVTDWFAGRELATGMSLLLITWPVGIALALATLGKVASDYSWQVAALVPVQAVGLALVVMALFYREAPSTNPGRAAPIVLPRREFLLASSAGWVWMIYNAGFIIIISFSPALLGELGRSMGDAGFTASLTMWVMIAAIPLGGVLADRLGTVRSLIGVGCLATAAAVAWLLQSDAPFWMFMLIGVAMGLPAGPIMTLPAAVLRAEHRGVGMGVYFTWYYIGMAVFPPIAGAIQDASGGAAMSMAFGAALSAGTVIALGGYVLVKRQAGAGELPAATDT